VDSNEQINFDEESFRDYPCHKNIIQQAYKRGSVITDLFQDIFDDGTTNMITFFYSPGSNVLGGQSRTPFIDRSYDITFGPQAFNASDLIFVTTVIHETLHANLDYIHESGGFQLGNNTELSYSNLLQAYINSEVGDNDEWEHTFMSNYRREIADAVYSWATSFGGYMPSQNLRNHLERIAWAGLRFVPDTNQTELTEQWSKFVNRPNNESEVLETRKVLEAEIFPFFDEITIDGIDYNASSIRLGEGIDFNCN